MEKIWSQLSEMGTALGSIEKEMVSKDILIERLRRERSEAVQEATRLERELLSAQRQIQDLKKTLTSKTPTFAPKRMPGTLLTDSDDDVPIKAKRIDPDAHSGNQNELAAKFKAAMHVDEKAFGGNELVEVAKWGPANNPTFIGRCRYCGLHISAGEIKLATRGITEHWNRCVGKGLA